MILMLGLLLLRCTQLRPIRKVGLSSFLQFCRFPIQATPTDSEFSCSCCFNAPKFSHVSPFLRSLHWLKIKERIQYKLLSLTYEGLTTSQPSCLRDLVSVQPTRCTRSLSVVTLARPSFTSSAKITNRCFRHASPYLWNAEDFRLC